MIDWGNASPDDRLRARRSAFPVEEILSNKLTTLVSRQEVRDLVDVFEMERRGYRVEDFLAEASAKDGGCTPATLAFLLSEWTLPESVQLPPGYSAIQLRGFKDSLAERLLVAAARGARGRPE